MPARSRLTAILLLLLASAATAQESTPEDAPTPFPLANISSRADELTSALRRIEAVSRPRADIDEIQQQIAADAAAVEALKGALDELDVDGVSPRVLDDLRVEWTSRDAKLEAWMGELQPRWENLTNEGEALADARAVWTATRARAVSDQAPEEIVVYIDNGIERIRAAEGELRQRSEVVASIMDRVGQGEDSSAENLERLNELAARARGRLLHRDAAPLWSASAEAPRLIKDATEARRYWWSTLKAFVSERSARFLVVFACFVLFLASSFWLERWTASWPVEDESLDRVRFVLSRKVSLSLAFAVLLIVFLFPSVVGPVGDLIELLGIVPVVRLARGLLAPNAALAVYATTGMLALHRLGSTAPNGSYLSRLLLLLVELAALAAAVYVSRRWRAARTETRGRFWSLAKFLLYASTAFVALSLGANVLGWTNLAQKLTTTVVETAYGAAGWVVVVLSMMALVPLLLRSGLTTALPSLGRHQEGFTRLVFVGWCVVGFWFWGSSALQRFQLLDPLERWTESVMSASATFGGLEVSIASVLGSVVVLAMTWVLSRTARFVLLEELLPRVRLPAGADHSVVSVVNYFVWGSGILLAGAAAGLTGTQLTVVFGALGVGIGFGLQNVVGNFVSGLILIFERPIKVGDQVQTSTHFGVVTGIGIRASTIRTFDGAEVVMPNSDLVAKEFVNWTRTDMTRRVEVLVRVALGTDPRQVLEILRSVASDHEKTLETPPPSALMTGFGESSLDFRLLVWTGVSDFLSVSSDLHVTVNDELNKAGIEIPVPRRELEISTPDAQSATDALDFDAASERSSGDR